MGAGQQARAAEGFFWGGAVNCKVTAIGQRVLVVQRLREYERAKWLAEWLGKRLQAARAGGPQLATAVVRKRAVATPHESAQTMAHTGSAAGVSSDPDATGVTNA